MTEQLSTYHACSLSVVWKAELFTAQDAVWIIHHGGGKDTERSSAPLFSLEMRQYMDPLRS